MTLSINLREGKYLKGTTETYSYGNELRLETEPECFF